MTFELLNIRPEIVRALKEDGIIKPTKIQKLAIPKIKEGRDVIAISRTGSGKTVAFGIPVLENLDPSKGLQVLILTPTRELTVQIARELEKFSKYIHCNVAQVYGGVSLNPQIKAIEKANIVVGTTGRTLDHMRRGNLNLSNLDCIILDEADKMVDMGFIEDIEQILSQTPNNRQVLLFGATISHEINSLKNNHMNNPAEAKAELHVKEDLLAQYYYDVKPGEKFSLLVHLLKNEDIDSAIIFCATRRMVDMLGRNLKDQGVKAATIHGTLTQNKRQRVIDGFNQGKPNILVASAVAARGLDIQNVSHVFNYGLSKDPQEYIHRVGRTARAGESGKAITLLEPRDHDAFSSILNNYDINVERLEKENFKKLYFKAQSHKRRNKGGRHRDRHRGKRRHNRR